MAMKHGEQRQQPFQKPKTIFGENALTLLPWQVDKQRFDIFSTEIKRICGETFIETSSPVDDIHHATDLKVYQISPLNIACRIAHCRLDCIPSVAKSKKGREKQ